jgi:2'-deoxynucleoside 5'-phosphate N-hydrolase
MYNTVMKAYFTASIVGKRWHLSYYKKIVEILNSHEVDVIADHILNVDEKDIQLQSKDIRLSFHTRLEKWINSSDFMVVESSFPSISVGYEISLAMFRDKPILVLYREGDPPSLFAYHKNERLVVEKYTDATLKPIIDDFINFAHSGSDHRFTFFITSEIARYLEDIAKKKKTPKSVYLRRLIETDMAESGRT